MQRHWPQRLPDRWTPLRERRDQPKGGLTYSIRFLTQYELPVSGVSALIGLAASAITGVAFGTLPAIRAARMDPVESLRYE